MSLPSLLRRLLAAGQLLPVLLGLGMPAARAQAPAADSAQVWQALKQAQYTVRTDTGAAGRTIRRALEQSRQLGFSEGTAVAYLLLGHLQARRGRNAAALLYYRRAERQLAAQYRAHPTRRLRSNLGMVANSIGVAERDRGHLQASIVAYLRATEYSTAARDYDGLVVLYSNLAGCFSELGQTTQALDYLHRSIGLRTRALHHPEQLLAPYISLALLLLDQHRRPEAGQYLAQARQLMQLPQTAHYVSRYERLRGIYYFEGGQYRPAQASFRRALAEVRREGNPEHAADLYQALGRTARQLGDYAGARADFTRGLQLARSQQNLSLTALLLESLAELEEAQGPGHAPAALAYFKQLKAVENRLESEKTKRTILQLETRYRTRQQQQQIRVLQAQRQGQQQELRRKTTLSYAAFALVGVLLGAVGLGFLAVRARQKLAAQHQQLQARKIQELEQERQLLGTEAMLRGQDEERRRIARDLHDGLGGMLSTVKYYLGTVRGSLMLPAPSAQLFARSLAHLDSAISELRRVARDMMPEALQQFGLVPALQDVCDALGHRRQLRVQLQAYGLAERLPQRTEVVVYRLVQELLNNVLKHADARHVIVQLVRTGRQVQVVVEDDGCGFDPAAGHRGVGLHSIQARVDYLRGTLDLHSRPGQGTTATIEFTLVEA